MLSLVVVLTPCPFVSYYGFAAVMAPSSSQRLPRPHGPAPAPSPAHLLHLGR